MESSEVAMEIVPSLIDEQGLLMTSPRPTTCFLDLPNEILGMIAEVLDDDSEEAYFKIERCISRPLRSLARVNKRLHAVVYPVLLHKLRFYGWTRFLDATESFCNDGPNSSMAGAIRSVRLSRIPTPLKRQEPTVGHNCLQLPFFNLNHFECTIRPVAPAVIEALGGCTHLRSLALKWKDSAPWPDFNHTPKVETLRLVIDNLARVLGDDDDVPWLTRTISFTPLHTYCSITTLALYNQGPKFRRSRIINYCVSYCLFPNLRALTLEGSEGNLSAVFHFIHRHPGLLEVSIMDGEQIRPEAVLQLIDGTGTWTLPSDRSHNARVSQVSIEDYNEADPYPPDIVKPPLGNIICNDFAFTRVPLYPGATQWQLPVGSPQPRYRCVSLAIQELSLPEPSDEEDHCSIMEWLKLLPNHVPALEAFRFVAVDNFGLGKVFGPWIEEMYNVAQGFKSLKRLSAHWFSFGFWWDRWPRIDYIPLLDEGLPPYAQTHRVFTVTLNDLKIERDSGFIQPMSDFDLARLEAGIRQVLCIDDDTPLDWDDDTLLMRAWEARHEHRVARCVRTLATRCPTLEEFEWYLVDDKDECPTYQAVRWIWKIYRDAKGGVKLVSGNLTWTKCPRGDPPKFYMLAGKELERALKLGKFSLNRYYRPPFRL